MIKGRENEILIFAFPGFVITVFLSHMVNIFFFQEATWVNYFSRVMVIALLIRESTFNTCLLISYFTDLIHLGV